MCHLLGRTSLTEANVRFPPIRDDLQNKAGLRSRPAANDPLGDWRKGGNRLSATPIGSECHASFSTCTTTRLPRAEKVRNSQISRRQRRRSRHMHPGGAESVRRGVLHRAHHIELGTMQVRASPEDLRCGGSDRRIKGPLHQILRVRSLVAGTRSRALRIPCARWHGAACPLRCTAVSSSGCA